LFWSFAMSLPSQFPPCVWGQWTFTVHPFNAAWNDVPGIYIFAGLNQQRRWVPLYMGQASSLRGRLCGHEQAAPAMRSGATHVHAAVFQLQQHRDLVERMLIAQYEPQLNQHYRRFG
jgi:excinuclease UvrABC nuclease subunit